MKLQPAIEQIKRVLVVYPSLREWINKESGDPAGTLEAWGCMLSTCDDRDVIGVVDLIRTGEIEPKGQYDTKDVLPRIIRRESINRGRDRERRERVAKLASMSSSNEQGRFFCGVCLDKGVVPIWHPDLTRDGRLVGTDGLRPSYCTVACVCVAGTNHRTGNDRAKPLIAYSELCMCKWNSGEIAELETWLDCSVENHPNYHAEFAEFAGQL